MRAGWVRGRDWRRVTRGAYASTGSDWLADLAAWHLVLPDGAAFTHLTAARMRGWWTLPYVEVPVVFAQAPPGGGRNRRPGVRVIRTEPVEPPDLIAGMPVASPIDILLACARDLGALDLSIIIDGALHAGEELEALRAAARVHRRGAPVLRRALCRADPRSESAWETALRLLHQAIDVPVVAQHVVEHEGDFVARGDLWIPGTRTLQEYDGGVHRTVDQQRDDLDRARRLNRAGWTRNGYTAREVVRQPGTVLRDADRALGRNPLTGRLDPWWDLLRGSSLTPAGCAQLTEQWTKAMKKGQ